MPTPEEKAREHIDQALEKSGWNVQDTKSANLSAGPWSRAQKCSAHQWP